MTYWNDMEIRLELAKGQTDTEDPFTKRMHQILLDMRLQQEGLESVMHLLSKVYAQYNMRGRAYFFRNLERVAFDTRVPPAYSDLFVAFLTNHRE